MSGRALKYLAIVAVFVAIGLSRSVAERDDDGQITTAGAVDAFEVQVGDCFDDAAFNGEVSEVPGVPCAEPHDNEVYATFDVTTDSWPGDEAIEEIATDGCYERFQAAIGESYEDSEIDFTTIYPSSGSWKERSDREVICVAYQMELEKLTGSVLGSGR